MGIFDKLKRKKQPQASKEDVKVSVAPKEAKAGAPTSAKKAPAKAVASLPVSETVDFAHKILLQPVMTEKSLSLHAQGKYTFLIATDANKYQVTMAMKELYGTQPLAVRMINIKPKRVMRWGRFEGTRQATKKAVVTLPKGTSLQLTE